jgi:hypothetical protein
MKTPALGALELVTRKAPLISRGKISAGDVKTGSLLTGSDEDIVSEFLR